MKVFLLLAVLIAAPISFAGGNTLDKPQNEAVVSYHPMATAIGKQILDEGGNAFDAFVATTMAQYVLAEGVTSLGGPLGALLYDAKSKRVYFLDAGFNSPVDPTGLFDPKNAKKTAGAITLVPGAPAGLEAISKRFGKLPFSTVIKPAIDLARDGFVINNLMASESSSYREILERTPYGSKTYLRDGLPLREGERIKLPEVAVTLENLARRGSSYMYTGDWAANAVRIVQAAGSKLTLQDFARYKAEWREPLSIEYRGYKIYSPSGKTYHGLTTLLALRALSRTPLSESGHFMQNPDALEKVVSVQNWAESFTNLYAFLNHGEKLEDQAAIESEIEPKAKEIWENVERHLDPGEKLENGSHSYHVVVIDREGNAITGTNTIESLPWGQGIFVDGIPLTDSGKLPFNTLPGQRNLEPLSMHIGMKDSRVAFAAGAFGASLAAAELQFILNAIEYNLPAEETMSLPRFGIEGVDLSSDKFPNGLIYNRTFPEKSC